MFRDRSRQPKPLPTPTGCRSSLRRPHTKPIASEGSQKAWDDLRREVRCSGSSGAARNWRSSPPSTESLRSMAALSTLDLCKFPKRSLLQVGMHPTAHTEF